MKFLKKIFRNSLREAINEAKKLPSPDEITQYPSVFKMIRRGQRDSFLRLGFQRSLAGDGGTCYGEGVYSSLECGGSTGAARLVYGYGDTLIQGKVIGGFENFIMFDGEKYESEKRQMIKYYGRVLSPYDQYIHIFKKRGYPDSECARLASFFNGYGVNVNNYPSVVKQLRKHGVRGMIYSWCSGPTVLPFDFSSVIIYAYADGVRQNEDTKSIKSKLKIYYDEEAKERFEKNTDWAFQLEGFCDSYDKERAVTFKDELYCPIKNGGRYNIAKIDTDNLVSPKPTVISDIWFDSRSTMPDPNNGLFEFTYNGHTWNGAISLPTYDSPVIWFPQNIDDLYNYPDINSEDDWIEMSKEELNGAIKELKYSRGVSETVITKKALNEEIRHNDEQSFISENYPRVYRATKRMEDIVSIFKTGYQRQFGGSNDGLWYGDGVYSVINPKKVNYPKYGSGRYGLESIIIGGYKRFFILDDYWANKIYGPKHEVKDQIYYLFGDDANEIWNKVSFWLQHGDEWGYEQCKYTMFPTNGRTTGLLHMFFNEKHGNRSYFEAMFRKHNVRGTIYTGGNDGLCALCYHYDQVIPYRYTDDAGRTWKKDLFKFNEVKERSKKYNDPVQKYGHLFKFMDDKFTCFCNIGGKNVSVISVQQKDNKWNVLYLDGGKLLSPFGFDERPQIGTDGTVSFKYKGVYFNGIVMFPGESVGAFWFPENPDLFYEEPDINSPDDWAGFDDLDNAVNMLKNQ